MKRHEAPGMSGGLVAFIEGQEMRSVVSWLKTWTCLLYTSPSPRDGLLSRMPSSA